MATGTKEMGGRSQEDPAPSVCEGLPIQSDAEGGLGYYRARKGGVRVLGPSDDVLVGTESWKTLMHCTVCTRS
jgi:hypothetical protein